MERITFMMLAGMAGLIFVVDLLASPGIAWWALYLIPLLLAFSHPNRALPLRFAAGAMILIFIGAVPPLQLGWRWITGYWE